ncbi:HAD-IA family hydrolase [Bremerella cremea]|uniref:HAD-IA family hydrolase n=1 Tax=Bremerella cremea TaxID=1031537 RepID=UPI0031EDF660
MPVQCVIFDLDGTLVDSETVGSQVLLELFPDLDDTLDSISERYRGWRMANILADIEQRLKRKLPESFEHDYRELAAVRLEEGLRPMPGVREMLDQLTLPSCVASNAPPEKIALALRIGGLSDYFGERMFSCYTVGAWKPDPKIFLHASQAMGFAPQQCVVVEDSDVGVAAGVAAGIPVLRYDPIGKYESSEVVQCFDQMAKLLPLIAEF